MITRKQVIHSRLVVVIFHIRAEFRLEGFVQHIQRDEILRFPPAIFQQHENLGIGNRLLHLHASGKSKGDSPFPVFEVDESNRFR